MTGLTISEMAESLSIEKNTVLQRLFVAKIKPITKEAIYPESALEVISNVPSKGRPRKVVDDAKIAHDAFIEAEKTGDIDDRIKKGRSYKKSLDNVSELLGEPGVLSDKDLKLLVKSYNTGFKNRNILSKIIIEEADIARTAFFDTKKSGNKQLIEEKKELLIELLIELVKYLLPFPANTDKLFESTPELYEDFKKVNKLYTDKLFDKGRPPKLKKDK